MRRIPRTSSYPQTGVMVLATLLAFDPTSGQAASVSKIADIAAPAPTDILSRYAFTELRRSDETVGGLSFSRPSIDESGDVYWMENRGTAAGSGVDAIVKSGGGAVEVIVADGGPRNFDIGFSLSRGLGFGVSGDGGVAFLDDKAADRVILRRPDGTLTTIFTESGNPDILGVDCCFGVSDPVAGTTGRVGLAELTFTPSFTKVADGLTTTDIGDTAPVGISRVEVRVNDDGNYSVLTVNDSSIDNDVVEGFGARFTAPRIGDFALNNNGDVFVSSLASGPGSGGGELILKDLSNAENQIATTAGPYRTFRDLNLNDVGQTAFRAERDFETDGIFTGGDSIADALLTEGSTLFGEQVTRVEMVDDDAINDAGQVTLSVETINASGDSVTRIVRADPRPRADRAVLNDAHALLSAFTGQDALLSTSLSLPGDDFSIGFSFDVLAGDPLLNISLGGQTLASLGQADAGIWEVAGIEPTPFGPEGSLVDLVFSLSGPGVVALDDLLLTSGDVTRSLGIFERGLPDGFLFDGDGGLSIAARGYTAAPIPLPAGGWGLLAALGFLGVAARRRSTADTRRRFSALFDSLRRAIVVSRYSRPG